MTDDQIIQTFLSDAAKFPLLTKAEEQELGKRICEGDRAAVDELVQRNLRLVASVAMRSPTTPSVSRADLIQEGTIGLMTAATKFDWRKGFKFSTYAVCWIRQAVQRAYSQQSRSVRLPQHTTDALMQVRRARTELEQERGEVPSVDDVAARVGITREKLAFLDDVGRDISSLNEPRPAGDQTLEDTLASIEYEVLDFELSDEMLAALATLTERERAAVVCRYGLDGADPRTWQEVGDELGIQKQSARGLERRGLRKLQAAVKG
jgi:RNA polymerase primary sigma factor